VTACALFSETTVTAYANIDGMHRKFLVLVFRQRLGLSLDLDGKILRISRQCTGILSFGLGR